MATEGIYSPLDPSRSEIRLLEVTSLTPHITCTLHTVSLQDGPIFCPLSYLWGDPTGTEPITVQGVEVLVTKSLRTSLEWSTRHWRELFPDRELSACRLWADALCINQKDVQEKNHQIPLMGRIYSMSEVTFCCLDAWAPEREISLALDIIRALARGVEASGFVMGMEEYQEVNADWLSTDPVILKHGTDPVTAEAAVAAVDAFGELEYWTRVWIHQELVLSKRALLTHSSRSLPVPDVMLVSEWSSMAAKATKPDIIHNRFWAKIQVMAAVGTLPHVRYSQECKKAYETPGIPSESRVPATIVVLRSADLAATDPKDHVYGLLEIGGLAIKPDYSPTRSLASVYIEFCCHSLNVAMVHIQLTFQKTGMPNYTPEGCPLRFLDFAGLANQDPNKEDYGLPSWVPNFPSISIERAQYSLPDMASRRNGEDITTYRGLIGGYDWYHGLSIVDETLRAPVLDIANLEQMTERITTAKETWPAFITSFFELFRQFPRGADQRHPLLRLADVFFTDHEGRLEVWQSPEVMRLIRVLQYLLYNGADLMQIHASGGGEAVMESLNKSIQATFGHSFLDDVWLGSEWLVEVLPASTEEGLSMLEARKRYRDTRDIKQFLAEVATDILTTVDLTSEEFEQILSDVNQVTDGQVRIARTEDDDFALVPECAQPGDFVAHIFGHHGLTVLREVENRFILVGECRVSTKLSQLLGALYAGDREFDMFKFR